MGTELIIQLVLWLLGFIFLWHIPLCRSREIKNTLRRTLSIIVPARNEAGNIEQDTVHRIAETSLSIDTANIFPRRVIKNSSVDFSITVNGNPGDEFDMLTLIIEDQAKIRVAIVDFSREKPYKIPQERGLEFIGRIENFPIIPAAYQLSLYVTGLFSPAGSLSFQNLFPG